MENLILIAPLESNYETVLSGAKEFRPNKVLLLSAKEDSFEKLKTELDSLNIKNQLVKLPGKNPWEETFKKVSELSRANNKKAIVGISLSGDLNCAAASAAFVNGLKAYYLKDSSIVFLPIVPVSYEKMLGGKKMDVLKELHKQGQFESLEQLGKNLKMSLPLISYHVNGNAKSDGLTELGLVTTAPNGGKVKVELSPLGKLLIESWN